MKLVDPTISHFSAIFAQKARISLILIFREPELVLRWQITHFKQKGYISIRVSYNLYSSKRRIEMEMAKKALFGMKNI